MRPAMLIVTMEPPASLEEEFNDWYDTEHFPQRRNLPGFDSATRWVCLDGWPRYVALYDLASMAVLDTPEYRAVSAANSTPWSRRILPRTIGRERLAGSRIGADNDNGHNNDSAIIQAAPRMLMASWPLAASTPAATLAAQIRHAAAALPGIMQNVTLEINDHNHHQNGGAAEIRLIASFDFPVRIAQLAALQRIEGIGADVFNLYRSYHRLR